MLSWKCFFFPFFIYPQAGQFYIWCRVLFLYKKLLFTFFYKGDLNQGTGWFQLIFPQFFFWAQFRQKSTPLRSDSWMCNVILQISTSSKETQRFWFVLVTLWSHSLELRAEMLEWKMQGFLKCRCVVLGDIWWPICRLQHSFCFFSPPNFRRCVLYAF